MLTTLHIFPSAAAADTFRRQSLADRAAHFGTTALTLKGLAEMLCQGGAGRQLSPSGQRMLLHNLVQSQYAGQTGHYAELQKFPGFVEALASCIAELKQAGIEAGDFAATVARLAPYKRLGELAQLFARYEKSLARLDLIDANDIERLAIKFLRQEESPPALLNGITSLQLHAIYDFTPGQLTLLCQLARRLQVKLALPYDPDRPELYAYVSRTADAIEALDDSALDLDLDFTPPDGPFLTALLAAIDAGSASPATPLPGPMQLLAAPGSYRECEEIGRKVRRLLEAGTDPAEIAVASRETRNFAPMFEDVCRRFRIPVSYRRGTPLAIAPLVQACLAPFRVIASRFGREELLALYSSSYAAGSLRKATPSMVEEVLLRTNYVDESIAGLAQVLDRRIKSLQREQRSSAAEERVRQVLLPLIAELRHFAARRSLPEFNSLLNSFIERQQYYQQGINAADERALKRDASSITLFRQLLLDLEHDSAMLGLAAAPIGPADYLELLLQGMQGVYLSGERRSGVSIMNFHELRGLTFPHLFLGGLNEGICPARHLSHPLFKDNDKLLFHKIKGGRIFRTADEKRLEEPLLFHLAISSATRSLTLSYSYLDGQGKELLRSPYLDELLSVIPLAEERAPVNRVVPPPTLTLEREELLNALALAGTAKLPPGSGDQLQESLHRITGNAAMEDGRERFFQAAGTETRSAAATKYTGALHSTDIRAELAAWYCSPPGNSFAPTTLEDYGACPFRYFLRRLLRLDPQEKPDLELPVRDEGALLHTILQEFYQQLLRQNMLPLRGLPTEQQLLLQIIASCRNSWESDRHIGEPLLWEISIDRLTTLLAGLVAAEGEANSPFIPQACELPFQELPVISPDGSIIFLHGKLDRLDADMAAGALRVVDYKLAANKQKYQQLLKREELGESSFQMPVYLLAAVRELEKRTGRHLTNCHVSYWLLRSLTPLEQQFSLDPADPAAAFFATDLATRGSMGDNNFLNRLCNKVAAMKNGDFQITPTSCDYCDFGAVCRYVASGRPAMAEFAGE